MTDRELLQAMDRMMDAKLQPICDGLDTVDRRLDTMQTDIRLLKDSVEEIRGGTNYVAQWVENLESAFRRHEMTATK
ncbi:hypothetical protein [Pseudoflavonifractor phocaeensis]|uniref:hypothetical protein n=1 Tax=Pseudoflavonifractor phocaeensis TaxID=1870988 RepID=UPI00210B5FD0|nr:hypothetical protein [Pseudoflavonifractor phocaeensis]MCQ4863775.1 hypothetical protein [Pseudoflavonifractor phocaeensis]